MKNHIQTLFALLMTFLSVPAFGDTYTLYRTSIIYSNGYIIDSLGSDVSVSGTMTVTGNRFDQTLTLCITRCEQLSATGYVIDIKENAHALTISSGGYTYDMVLLSAYPTLMTYINAGTYTEVDQWILTSRSKKEADKPADTGSQNEVRIVRSLGEALLPYIESGELGPDTIPETGD